MRQGRNTIDDMMRRRPEDLHDKGLDMLGMRLRLDDYQVLLSLCLVEIGVEQ